MNRITNETHIPHIYTQTSKTLVLKTMKLFLGQASSYWCYAMRVHGNKNVKNSHDFIGKSTFCWNEILFDFQQLQIFCDAINLL